MTDAQQAFRARVINLCFGVLDSCSLTDLDVLKTQAGVLMQEMGMSVREVKHDDYEEFL